MRQAEDYLHHLGEARRAELAELLDVARQRAAAAEGLWSVGHTVEALGLARDALDDTVEVAMRFAELERGKPSLLPPAPRANLGVHAVELNAAGAADADPGPEAADGATGKAAPGWVVVLKAQGISEAGVRHALHALETAHRTDFPRLERNVTRAQREAVRDILRVRLALDDAVSEGTRTHTEIRRTRRLRTGIGAVAIVACVALAAWALVPRSREHVTASGVWAGSWDYRPEVVLDGDPSTMWILPDGSEGWVEVELAPARRVERVTLVNAGPPALRDRGTRAYRLEIHAGGSLARTLEGELGSTEGSSATHEVGLDGVERIRFVVDRYYGLGGGLAELRWE